jgi:transposase
MGQPRLRRTQKAGNSQQERCLYRGGGPKKQAPHSEELKILKLRQSGLSKQEVADMLGISKDKVKRAVRECSKFGYKLRLKPGPKKGCEGKPRSEETRQKIREKREEGSSDF